MTCQVACKMRHVTGDYHVWVLTNPINAKLKPNSGDGVGIQTDPKH